MENNEFDDIIKNKLESISELPNERSWDLFVLAAMEKQQEEIFDDTSTDELVRSAFKDFKVNYDAHSWETLENKLEQEDAIVTKFDKEISNSLKSLKRKYDASSWPKLAARIEAEEKYLREYYRAKFIEAILFIFFIFTLFQLSESGKIKLPFSKDPVEINTNSPNSSEPISSKPEIAHATIPSSIENSILASTGDMSNNRVRQNISPYNGPSSRYYQNVAISKQENIDQNIFSHSAGSTRIPQSIQSIVFIPASNFIDRSTHLSNQAFNRVSSELLVSIGNHNKQFKNSVALLDSDFNEVNSDSYAKVLKPVSTKSKLHGSWKLGTYARADYNEIYLPSQKLEVRGSSPNDLQASTSKSMGYSSGFKALYIKNRMGIEFGAGYTNRYYKPDRYYYGATDLFAHFYKIEYEMVELPISVRYSSKLDSRLRPYIQVGLNSSFIAKSIYDVSVKPKFVSTSNSFATTRKPEIENYKAQVTEQFIKYDNNKVLAYAQGSMGLEWKLNSTVSLNSQITYSQRFLTKKFGPNFDQAKSLSLEIGIKTNL